MSDLTAWILSIGSFAGVVVCMAVASKSIAGDPARGRRRCPRCWHELGPSAPASASLTCSECGHTARDERDVTRTRRNPVRAVLAIAGVIAIAVSARIRLLDRGPWSLAPTSVLLMATPGLADGGYRSAAWELAYRIRSGAASEAQTRAGLALFIEGDPDARPPSAAWRAKYRDLGSASIGRLGNSDPDLIRLYEIPPAFEIAAVPGCTLDGDQTPALLAIDAGVWWPDGSSGELEVVFKDGSSRRAEFFPAGRFPELLVELPNGSAPGEQIGLRFSIRIPGELSPDRALRAFPEVKAAVPDFATKQRMSWRPVDSPVMRDAIAEVFSEGLVVWSDGSPRGGMRFDHRLTARDEFLETAVGLKVEILEHGVVRRTSRMWWIGGVRATDVRWLPSIEDTDALARLHGATGESDAGWTLRISGDEALAHRAAKARTDTTAVGEGGQPRSSGEEPLRAWFCGSVELPLRVTRMNSPSPVRRWKLMPPVAP